MKTLSDIETLVQLFGRNSDETITSGSNLALANTVYRNQCLQLSWPELYVENTNMSTSDFTTASGASTADWPATPVFLDLQVVEVQDGDDADRYKIITPAGNAIAWAQAQHRPAAAVPAYYAKFKNPANNKLRIEVREAFKFTGKTIRRAGVITPDELESEEDATVFENPAADDAYAHLVAAALADIDGFSDYAGGELSKAGAILSRLRGRDLSPQELGALINRS